jgi:hypothetical protein
MALTIHDWLRRAQEATDPAEADRCLDAAAALAEDCFAHRALLGGLSLVMPLRLDRLAAACARALPLATAERDVWGFRDVAEAHARHLRREDARAALEAGEAAFGAARTTPGYVWVLLGEGWLSALQDRAGLRRCLQSGEASARARSNADDLCAIAVARGKHLDRARGVVLMRKAEALARNGTASPWTLANGWHALDEPRAARRLLLRACRQAGSPADALHVARAFASHGKADGVRTALQRARALAKTGEDWLAVAEVAVDTGAGEDAVRGALSRAAALAGDADLRARVATGYEDWLGDAEAAAAVGPRGVPPEALGSRERPLPGWEGSAAGLLDWLRARLPAESLRRIARADYGSDEAKHLAALGHIQRTGVVPRCLAWEPHEVLALTRWSSGEGVDHLARAFSCTLLCLARGDMDELVSTGPILAESCLALGPEARDLGAALFVWLAEAGPELERPVALLLVLLLRLRAEPGDPRLPGLARAIGAEGDVAALGESLEGSMSAALWRELIEASPAPPPTAGEGVGEVLRGLRRGGD